MKGLLQYSLYILAAFYCMQVSAVTIYADTVSTISDTMSYNKNYDVNSTVIVTLQPPGNPGDFENQNISYDCPSNLFTANEFKVFYLTTEGEMTSKFTNKGSCKRVSVNFERHPIFHVRYNLANNTLKSQSVELYVIWILSGGKTGHSYYTPITIPANTTCAATVDNVNLGIISTGETKYSSIGASFSGTASSKSLTFTSSDMTSDGILQLGGASSKVKVYPTNSNNKSGNKWKFPSMGTGTLPLTVDVTSGIRGTWKSSLLVTLDCS